MSLPSQPLPPVPKDTARIARAAFRRSNSVGVIEALADTICQHGIPKNIRCDNGPEPKDRAAR